MTTLRQIAGAVQIQLKQLGDDRQIPFLLMVQWCGFFINKYRYEKGSQKEYINQGVSGQRKSADSGNYLAVYSNVPVVVPTVSINPNIVAGRKYIELPETIYDYLRDDGIDYISYSDFDDVCQPSFAGVRFTRTTPTKAKRIYYSEYEKPTPSNPYFYRTGNYVPLLGIEQIIVNVLEVGLITAFNPFTTGSLDTALDMGEEGFDYVVKNVLDLGRFMLLVPSDRLNDATAEVQQEASKGRVVNVNQQPIEEEQ